MYLVYHPDYTWTTLGEEDLIWNWLALGAPPALLSDDVSLEYLFGLGWFAPFSFTTYPASTFDAAGVISLIGEDPTPTDQGGFIITSSVTEVSSILAAGWAVVEIGAHGEFLPLAAYLPPPDPKDDFIDQSSSVDDLTIKSRAGDDTVLTGSGDDLLVGGRGDDHLSSGAGRDVLQGREGRDTLFGEGGRDKLFGGLENDVLIGGQAGDVLKGGAGFDTIEYSTSSAAVMIDLLAGTADGGDATGDTFQDVEHVTGSAFNDDLSGDDFDNDLIGGDGNDILRGRNGNDRLFGDIGRDRLKGGADDDVLNGGRGRDVLDGGNGIDNVVGGGGKDIIRDRESGSNIGQFDFFFGGSGNDVIEGRFGGNFMSGGAGADTFVFEHTQVNGFSSMNMVTDFEVGVDILDFSRIAGIDVFEDLGFEQSDATTLIWQDDVTNGIIRLTNDGGLLLSDLETTEIIY